MLGNPRVEAWVSWICSKTARLYVPCQVQQSFIFTQPFTSWGVEKPVRIGILGLSSFVRNDWAACLSHWLRLMYLATLSLCKDACMLDSVPSPSKRASSSSQLMSRCFWSSENKSRCWALGPARTTMPEKCPANVTTTDLHQQALFSRYSLALFLHPLCTHDKFQHLLEWLLPNPQ